MKAGKNAFIAFAVLGLVGVTVFSGMPEIAKIGSAHAAATPFVTPDVFSGLPGSSITISGGNFMPGETVDISLGSVSAAPVATTTARGDSLFGPVSVNIPATSTAGPLAIIATGASSTFTASNSYYVEPLNPVINVTSTTDMPGNTMSVSGTGFAAGEVVGISLDGSTTTAMTDASGTFPFTALTIPFMTPGNATVSAHGFSSGANASALFYVGGFYPTVTPSIYWAYPGDTVTFSGSGFAPNERVNVFEDSAASSSANFQVNSAGTFSDTGTVVIPIGISATSTTFSLVGASSSAGVSVAIALGTRSVFVTPSGYYFLPGQTVSFSGTGFAPNETVSVKAVNATGTLASFTADASGTFSNAGSFVIPAAFAHSTSSVIVSGATSGASIKVSFTVGGYTPYLSPTLSYLQRGNSFSVNGYGFAPDENVSFSTYGNAAQTVAADASGTVLAGPFQVPLSAPSSVAVTALGDWSGAGASTTITIGDTVPRQLSSSTLQVAFSIDNSAGGSASSSDFTINVTGADADPASFSATSAPLSVIVLGDTDFAVSVTSSMPGYVITSSGICNGQIVSGATGSCSLTATYAVPITISSASLPAGTVGSAYSAVLSASTTASGSFDWSVASGTLPSGLALDASSHAATTSISGTPTAAGTYSFTVGVTNGSSAASQAYTVTVASAPSSGGGNTGGGGGGGSVVSVASGGSGGGGGIIPIPTTGATSGGSGTVASTTTGGGEGLVLGASTGTLSVAELNAQLISFQQQLISLQLAVSGFKFSFPRNLRKGMSGTDVMNLQKALNASSLTQVAASGPGSPGHETSYFGPATMKAVIAFQNIFASRILVPNGLSIGNGFAGPSTRATLNMLFAGGANTVTLH